MTRFHKREAQKIVASFIGSNTLSIRGALIAIILMIIASWLPDGLIEVVAGVKEEDKVKVFCQLLISSGLLVWLMFFIKNLSKSYVPTVDIEIEPSPQASKVLILFLSANPKVHEVLHVNSIDELERNNFRMPLLAINHHKTRLKKVIVICSEDSQNIYEPFKNLVQKLLPTCDISMIEQTPSVIDFEDGNAVYELLETLYQDLAKAKYKHKEIMIDITGGTKVVTLASAIFAIPNDKELEYVSTSDYQIKTYDIRYSEAN
ncbi:hypothetical protein FA592_02995 [Sulfurospirillum diekertiae]|uniref:Uncharacterized protein n=1 Tax=Sulfurospirillum diekertiae TaxID=1854492 RepID=A0A6G9VPF8_9BACT|nr:TM1812 family CRISPR-associated protein [Sulfurospirillum diekertiae]QIR75248.1 hypothetical protein FA584_03095 [Sulfurospirillum diekertiae]QIR77899.1 hypothetical protein FA592_02995 [Sulfurospirillum diekertiae]